MQFIQGLIGVITAFLIIRFRRQLYEFTGPIDFAERYITNTVNFYALVGILGIIISIMWMFGTIQSFILEKGSQFL